MCGGSGSTPRSWLRRLSPSRPAGAPSCRARRGAGTPSWQRRSSCWPIKSRPAAQEAGRGRASIGGGGGQARAAARGRAAAGPGGNPGALDRRGLALGGGLCGRKAHRALWQPELGPPAEPGPTLAPCRPCRCCPAGGASPERAPALSQLPRARWGWTGPAAWGSFLWPPMALDGLLGERQSVLEAREGGTAGTPWARQSQEAPDQALCSSHLAGRVAHAIEQFRGAIRGLPAPPALAHSHCELPCRPTGRSPAPAACDQRVSS